MPSAPRWLRIDLLKPEAQPPLRDLFMAVDSRIRFYDDVTDEATPGGIEKF